MLLSVPLILLKHTAKAKELLAVLVKLSHASIKYFTLNILDFTKFFRLFVKPLNQYWNLLTTLLQIHGLEVSNREASLFPIFYWDKNCSTCTQWDLKLIAIKNYGKSCIWFFILNSSASFQCTSKRIAEAVIFVRLIIEIVIQFKIFYFNNYMRNAARQDDAKTLDR